MKTGFYAFNMAVVGLMGVWSSCLATAQEKVSQSIIFFGDSLTAGYGVDYEQSYPMVLRELLAENGLDWKVVPSGVSGETSAGGLRRVNWVLRNPCDVFVLALGGNDGLRGIDLSDTRENLIATARRVKAKNPEALIIIAGMQMPPNLGKRYTDEFKALYPEVAKSIGAHLVPFLLEGVGGDPKLNQRDGIHPNSEGHRVIAQHLFESLAPILRGEDKGS